jgi:hypothetical protein
MYALAQTTYLHYTLLQRLTRNQYPTGQLVICGLQPDPVFSFVGRQDDRMVCGLFCRIIADS